MVAVDLVRPFLAGQVDLPGVDDDDEIPAFRMGGEHGLVLAHEHHGDPRSEAAEGLPFGVDEVPLPDQLALLGKISIRHPKLLKIQIPLKTHEAPKNELAF